MSDDPVQEFEEKFSELKKSLGFASSLDDLEQIFFLRDMAAADGPMPRLDRQICRRIVDTFFSWNNFLHRLIMPNPHSMFESEEASFFSQEDHDEMFKVMYKILAHCTRNNVIGTSTDTSSQKAFIDDSLTLWKELLPFFAKTTERVQTSWAAKN